MSTDTDSPVRERVADPPAHVTAADSVHEQLRRFLQWRYEHHGKAYFKAKFVGEYLDEHSAKELGQAFHRLAECGLVERWGYTSATTWRYDSSRAIVRPIDRGVHAGYSATNPDHHYQPHDRIGMEGMGHRRGC